MNFNLTANASFGNAISGNGTLSLVAGNTAMIALSSSNTYTGATKINAGTLKVTGSLANTATTVNSGGILTGSGNNSTTGVIGGSVTVNGGGTISLPAANSHNR